MLVHAGCAPIVLVVPQPFMAEAKALFGSRDGLVFAVGGETRQDSVARGLDEIATETVVVHDGARPFATSELVAKLLGALAEHDGAIAAMPVDETLKKVDGDRIVETVDRSSVWRAQTPQAFRSDVLRRAHARAAGEGFIGTDDAALLERYGGTVCVVQGVRSNIKLTYPEDFALAEAILRGGLR